jgi:hypothetical protein
MTLLSLDVVLMLPEILRVRAITHSEFVSEKIAAGGSASFFRLGKRFPGEDGGLCEPHVSLFMLAVDETEVDGVTRAVENLAKTLLPLAAEGMEYRHNSHGALEVYFSKSMAWNRLQRAVIMSVEPLRRERLRETDPSGARIRDLLDSSLVEDSRRRQLVRYGYDEVADEENGGCDRFNPHITLAWPRDRRCRVGFHGLPDPRLFSGMLTELGVFGMSAYGTCTKNYGVFSLGASTFMPDQTPIQNGVSSVNCRISDR